VRTSGKEMVKGKVEGGMDMIKVLYMHYENTIMRLIKLFKKGREGRRKSNRVVNLIKVH
jgi:hypothetical protein